MVQRKVPSKPDIQYDRAGSEKRAVNLKTSSLQNQDVKNRAADMKKKMMIKRSNLLKQLDFDALHPPDLVRRRVQQQPGKATQAVVAPAMTTTTTKATTQLSTPNYMKSTSSSAAKKEAKTSGKANGLKTARALMKNPSFKPGRSLMKNLDVHRATCSSTLKDFTFPAYLELAPGGTELEGTSLFKVCPYSYCSLNGHRHANLPPLKSFLSSRRRLLKQQRNTKPGCLPLTDLENPAVDKLLDEKDVIEVELDACSSLHEMDQLDFFIEIHGGRDETEYNLAEISINDQLNELDSEPETSNESADDYQDYDVEFLSNKEEGFDEESCQKLVNSSHDTASSCFDEYPAFTEESSISSSDECESVEYLEQEEAVDEHRVIIDESDHECIDKDLDQITSDQESAESPPPPSFVDVAAESSRVLDPTEAEYDATKWETRHCSIATTPDSNIMAQVSDQDFHVLKGTPSGQDSEEEAGEYNMRGPNFLPLQPVPEAEKVDLRHQEQDEKRNAEEWMVDYTLRQTVTRLGPARRKKVAMLVEAFEKVMPIAKFELNLGHGSGFDRVRPIQACN